MPRVQRTKSKAASPAPNRRPDPALDDELEAMTKADGIDEDDLMESADDFDLPDEADADADDGWGADSAEDDDDLSADEDLEEEDEWTREAWSDYMSTRAAVRSDGGNGGSFFYE